MATTTFHDYNGDQGSGTGNTQYDFTFPTFKQEEVKVEVDGVVKTLSVDYSVPTYSSETGGKIQFLQNKPTLSTQKVRVYRETDVDAAKATFTAGSSLKANELNTNLKLLLRSTQDRTSAKNVQTHDLNDRAVTTDKIRDLNVTRAKLAADVIDGSKIADDSIDSEHIAADSIDSEHYAASSVDTTAIANNAVTMDKLASGALPTDITVASANLVDSTIVDADINASANIAGTKLADDSVTLAKLGSGALPTDITVASANIVNGTIVNADVSGSAAIAGTKVAPDFGSQNISTSGTLTSGAQNITGNITVSGNVDGRDVSTDGTKLDGIESGATADQTAAEIKSLYESVADTNEYTDTEKAKLAGIETGATADQSNAEIRAAVEAATDSNVFTDADHSKLNAIEASATADQTDAEIKTAYENNANTNEFSDAEQSKLAGIETAATADQTASEIKTLLQSDKLTLSEMNTTSLDTRYFTETEADARYFRQDSSETIDSGDTWSSSDAFIATTGAINARIVDLVDDVGGFTAITSEQHFPNTNPSSSTGQATILSIQAASTALAPSGTTVTISNGNLANNANITITGVTATIPSGFGFLVESTSTLHTYTFHRLIPKATEVSTVANNITNIVAAGANVADINNFADLYQISGSAPTQRADGSSLAEGDLWFDSSNDNIQVYTGTAFSAVTPSQSVLDDIAIVSGAVTYSEDLGLITNAASTGSSNGSLDIVADVLEDEITFTVTASGGKFYIDGDQAPALTLYKGWTYTFDLSDSSNGSHPLRFSSGGSAYNTGVTVTGTQGQAGSKVQLVVPESQPTSFAYYCTAHSGMGNTITVKDDPLKTVSDNITDITAVAGNSTNINAVASNASNINSVASNSSNINSAVSNASNINAAVSNASNINAVAGNNSDITAVANALTNINAVQANATNVNAVAGNATNINAVAADATDIGAVAGKATEIGRLGTADAVADLAILGTTAIVSDMDTLADISSNITSVANNASNINSAVSNASNINSAVSNASNINTVAGNNTNISTVAGISANVTTVAGIDSDVTTVAGISSNVTSVAGNASNINSAVSNATNINAVVSNATNINAVAGNNSNITAVADNATNINAVAADATDIGAVAGKATEIGRLGTADAVADLAILGTADAVADMNTLATSAIVSDMDTLADISSNITTVANNDSNITAVANNSSNINSAVSNASNINSAVSNASNINTVAGISSNVTTVATNNANVTAVAGKATEIGRLGTADAVADMAILGTTDVVADMNTLATNAIVSDMDTLADIASDITTVADNDSNITAVAGNATNINAAVSNATNINNVVSAATNINSVAGNSTNINAVAGNATNINTVAGANSNITTVAGSISNINTTASNISNVNNFANRYRIASSAPTSSLDQGDLYFDTSSNELRVYNGSAWQGGVTATGNLPSNGANTFTGDQTVQANIIVTGTVDGRDVATDGSKLDGIETGATADQTAAEIRTLVESASDSNVFTDADHSKLNGIAAGATNVTNTNQLTNGAGFITATLTTEQVQDIVGGMFTGNTETNITATYQDSDGTIDLVSTDTNTTYSVGDGGLTQNNFTNTLKSKLDGIEASADVTDATNVNAAGAVMNSDSTTASMSFVVDEDNMSSNSATKVPTQQSVKAYVDAEVAGVVDSAPGALNTLNELAAALGDDASFSTTVTNSIATKLPLAGGTMTGNIVMSGSQTVDGRDLSADGSKLDGIESGATADQTAAEIRTLVESASNSNVFTDADHSKLNGIESGATADQTASEIVSLISGQTIAPNVITTTNLTLDFGTL